MILTHRLAQRADLEALRALMDVAISELQTPFLDARQIESSRTIMGLDTQLLDDGTYFIVDAATSRWNGSWTIAAARACR